MFELISLYWITILAACFTGATLSVIGSILVTRKSEVQTMAISQSASFGVSLGLLLSIVFFSEQHLEHTVLPLFTGILFSSLSFILTDRLTRKHYSPTVVHLSVFTFFWGITQLGIGFFPAVEGHISAIYFGDLVTLTIGESFFFLSLSSLSSFYLLLFWKPLVNRAFLSTILEEPFQFKNIHDLSFYFVSLLLVCLSVQLLGLLFTLAALFIPTAIYSYSRSLGVYKHLSRLAISTSLAVFIGFLVSLSDSRFLTTPLIVCFLCILPLFHLILERAFFRCK